MHPIHVGWCLPLPIHSSKIVLPTQKLTSYLTIKLTTHTLPYPKLNKKLTIHKEVVSAQGAAVGAIVGICWSFEASQEVRQKNIRTISNVGTLRNNIHG
jgi:hypothetical protein